MIKHTKITFEQILPIWQQKLWADRDSPIETHSAMTWPFEGNPNDIDMSIFDYPASFFGTFVNDILVGVNSGHRTTDNQYRSRGIWVDPEYRGYGFSKMLFALTQSQAFNEGCEMIWSIPRKTALPAYTKFGFETVGDYIKTETADANIYVKKYI